MRRLFSEPVAPAPSGPATDVAHAVVPRIDEVRRLAKAALGAVTIESLVASLEAEALPAVERPTRLRLAGPAKSGAMEAS